MFAKDAARKITRKATTLKRMPFGKKPQSAGVVLRTESTTVVQRRRNSLHMHEEQKHFMDSVKKQIGISSSQRKKADDHYELTADWRYHRECASKESLPAWKSPVQKNNSEAASKREEYWQQRREAVHQQSLLDEQRRDELLAKRTRDDILRKRRVANMRDLRRIHFASKWLDRRITWAANSADVASVTDNFNARIIAKQEDSAARVEDQEMRVQECIEFKREFAALHRGLVDMAEARENRKRAHRRAAVAAELAEFAAETEAASALAASASPSSPSASRGILRDSSVDFGYATAPVSPQSATAAAARERGLMTLSWASSPGTKARGLSTSPMAKSSAGAASFGSTPAYLSRSRGSPTARVAPPRHGKGVPRFDWGRFGAETLALAGDFAGGCPAGPRSGGGSPARIGLSLTASAPSLLASAGVRGPA